MKYSQNYSNPLQRSDLYHHSNQPRQQNIHNKSYYTDVKRKKSPQPPRQTPKYILQPGTPCEPLQEILATTKSVQHGATITRISKALSGSLLKLASKKPPQQTLPSKKIQLPKNNIPSPISGNLEPHIPSYSATTHEGNYRDYNQDKMAIIIQEDIKWFGIYDGHGGDKCSIFLKENLHKQFFRIKNWRSDVKNALISCFQTVERMWMKTGDKSGSCCIVTIIYEDICYVANLGDSRAILVSQLGKKVYQITKDHKPCNQSQQQRILSAGGKIYQTIAISQIGDDIEQLTGPLRVYPGRLSTTRTFGDIEAKDPRYNGNSKVVISQPEITSFNISGHDFIIMGSDGIWDVIQNKDALKIAKDIVKQQMPHNEFCQMSSDKILKESILRGSTDNVSVIVIGLLNLYQFLNPKQIVEECSNEHIKVLNVINTNQNIPQKKKKKQNVQNENKQNFPAKLKIVDNRISDITKNAQKLTAHNHR